jgi:hypothetical protein
LKAGDQQVVAGAYKFFINRGEPGSESALIKVLDMRNDQAVLNDFLNCGNDTLAQAARDWAKKHGYSIHSGRDIPGKPVWGSKR